MQEEPIYSVSSFAGDNGGNIYTNPMLTGYVLQEGSPCIDTGTSIGSPSNDSDGNSRPLRSGIDIGAYELPTATSTPSSSLTSSLDSVTTLPQTGADANN